MVRADLIVARPWSSGALHLLIRLAAGPCPLDPGHDDLHGDQGWAVVYKHPPAPRALALGTALTPPATGVRPQAYQPSLLPYLAS